MWHVIPKDLYMELYKTFPKLTCFSSFTDMDGTSEIGNGRRHLITEWGVNGCSNPILKCEEMGQDDGSIVFEYSLFVS